MSETIHLSITGSRKEGTHALMRDEKRYPKGLSYWIIPIFTNHLMLPYLPHYQHYFRKTSTLIY